MGEPRKKAKPERLERAAILRVAASACVDQRTVDRVVNDGEIPRSLATLRAITSALDEEGFPDHATRLREASS